MILLELVLAAVAQVSPTPEPVIDERPDFNANGWAGVAVDTFASSGVNAVLNGDTSAGQKLRGVGGFAFAYRAAESDTGRQLWVTAETHHGVRSADVDCAENASFPTCVTTPQPPSGDDLLFLIRNASTLEASIGLRWEFLTLQREASVPAKLYVSIDYGLVVAADGPGDAATVANISLGIVATKGVYRDTFLQLGVGRNDLFSGHERGRFVVQGGLRIHVRSGLSFFARLNVDTDVGPGADSLQSYYGFAVDPGKVFGR